MKPSASTRRSMTVKDSPGTSPPALTPAPEPPARALRSWTEPRRRRGAFVSPTHRAIPTIPVTATRPAVFWPYPSNSLFHNLPAAVRLHAGGAVGFPSAPADLGSGGIFAAITPFGPVIARRGDGVDCARIVILPADRRTDARCLEHLLRTVPIGIGVLT